MSFILLAATIFSLYYIDQNQQRKVILARQKMIKSAFSIYIDNYDDLEFEQKVRKVKDADLQQLNLQNEDDLAKLSPRNNPNFFSQRGTRSRPVNQNIEQLDFSDHIDVGQETESLNDT